MTIKQTIDQMEKEFDELFVGEKSYPRKGLYTERIRVFYKDFFRTLLESFGEEIINKLEEDVGVVLDSEVIVVRECVDGVFTNARLKVKEIISSIGKL